MRDEAVCSLFETACWTNADQTFLSVAIQQGQPTMESRSTTTQHARESRRVRSRDQSQNGIFSFAFCFLDFADNETTCLSPNIYSPENGKEERRTGVDLCLPFIALFYPSLFVTILACTTLLCSRNHDIIFVHRKGTWQTNYRQLLLTTYIH